MEYNKDAALGGNLRTIQGDVGEDCGYSGILASLEFMDATADPARIPALSEEDSEKLPYIRTETANRLDRYARELKNMKWYEHNLVTLRAKKALLDAGYGE